MKWHAYNLLADIDSTWRPPGYSAGAPWPARDVTFTDRVLSDLIAQSNIDTLRMHATGFSNGGGFVSKLAVELGTRIASVASISPPARSPSSALGSRSGAFFAERSGKKQTRRRGLESRV